MMRNYVPVFLTVLLFIIPLSYAIEVSTTPLQDNVLYVDNFNRYFYIYVNNGASEMDYVRIEMEPNSDYKFADSEFSFLYEQQLHPHQSLKIPIRINTIGTEFPLSYSVESTNFKTYDSFIVIPANAINEKEAAGYTIILTLFASAIMVVLYTWNRFVYNSYKIDYQRTRGKRPYHMRKKHYKHSSSAKL